MLDVLALVVIFKKQKYSWDPAQQRTQLKTLKISHLQESGCGSPFIFPIINIYIIETACNVKAAGRSDSYTENPHQTLQFPSSP